MAAVTMVAIQLEMIRLWRQIDSVNRSAKASNKREVNRWLFNTYNTGSQNRTSISGNANDEGFSIKSAQTERHQAQLENATKHNYDWHNPEARLTN